MIESGLTCRGCRVGGTNGLVSTARLFFVRHLSSLSRKQADPPTRPEAIRQL